MKGKKPGEEKPDVYRRIKLFYSGCLVGFGDMDDEGEGIWRRGMEGVNPDRVVGNDGVNKAVEEV